MWIQEVDSRDGSSQLNCRLSLPPVNCWLLGHQLLCGCFGWCRLTVILLFRDTSINMLFIGVEMPLLSGVGLLHLTPHLLLIAS
jgi:hypothetical protein